VCPIVFVGTQYPANINAHIAKTTLACALSVAYEDVPGGVYAVFPNEETDGDVCDVFEGGFFRKTSNGESPFTYLRPQTLAAFDNGNTHVFDAAFAPKLPEPMNLGKPFDSSRDVRLIRSTPLPQPPLTPAELATVDAVVVETYACGTVPDDVITYAAAAVSTGIPVWACPPEPIEADPEDSTCYASTNLLRDAGVTVTMQHTIELVVPAMFLRR
jgi:L-asparaginase/Glu-tRNA(Gln) amidotransferase subunit D